MQNNGGGSQNSRIKRYTPEPSSVVPIFYLAGTWNDYGVEWADSETDSELSVHFDSNRVSTHTRKDETTG